MMEAVGTIVILLILLIAGWVGLEGPAKSRLCWPARSAGRMPRGSLDIPPKAPPKVFDAIECARSRPPSPPRRRDYRMLRGGESLAEVNARWDRAHPAPTRGRAPVVRWGTPLVDSR